MWNRAQEQERDAFVFEQQRAKYNPTDLRLASALSHRQTGVKAHSELNRNTTNISITGLLPV